MKVNDAVIETYGIGVGVTQVRAPSTVETERDRGDPRKDVRFFRGILLAALLSLPLWAIIVWLISLKGTSLL
jgi:hypothetical protein